jgi:Resolvase, N terminal domain
MPEPVARRCLDARRWPRPWRVFEGARQTRWSWAKLDRLSRSLLDFASLMEDARREGWALVILDLGIDTTTPSGEMIANVMATFAQFERRLIGQRTKDALR